MSAPKWSVGMRRLLPGVYVDSQKALHLDLRELCIANGYAPTQQNADMLERVMRSLVSKEFGEVSVSHAQEE